ncbi:protein-methionine-sulfoxide reductase catalytic subunit MsrP [Marinivivus vitaminiproducens]|uniref:protein-methionine-sulfoxide reductase catalytic subunit MsrP n=1 Tax=Marinivivus vitaminiproducens TaxID=3035935 RepID=UPI0027A439A3|nr:protein-methionine-sulfoxide reductase catalytic subunit MsrP [Geminicoccaceae bacterium SCSIO 64248]
MLIRRRRGWELPEREVTSESLWLSRRSLLGGGAALTAGALLPGHVPGFGMGRAEAATGPYPVARNERYTVDRPITDRRYPTTYNNFYEFNSSKDVVDQAQGLETSPWSVTIDGMVEEERTVDFEDILAAMPLEERVYRHRCVEAWSMVVPWSGFPLSALVAYAKPTADARYLRMQTFDESDAASGLGQFWYPWPYVEGLTMEEANNELAFIATGLYGDIIPKQNGAPLRLVVPWKYGFKSIKSIVKFTFTDERPVGLWQALQESEYGFWANVNPEVPHPRWSQATERPLGMNDRIPTQLFNGYGDYVAHLYTNMDSSEQLYM